MKENLPEEAMPLADYFERTYIGSYRAAEGHGIQLNIRRQPPRFPHALWNVRGRTLADEPRTTNSLEGWHRRMKNSAGKAHPNLFEFILNLCNEPSHTETLIQKMLAGDAPEPPRKRTRLANNRITNVVSQYEERSPIDYLMGLAYNIEYVL